MYLFAAGGELLPKFVHFRLRLAVHHKRYGLGKFEERTAVKRHKFLSFKLEFNDHDRPFRPGPSIAIAGNFPDLGILEDGGVELRCLLGLIVEPQEWGDFLHMGSFQLLWGDANNCEIKRRTLLAARYDSDATHRITSRALTNLAAEIESPSPVPTAT